MTERERLSRRGLRARGVGSLALLAFVAGAGCGGVPGDNGTGGVDATADSETRADASNDADLNTDVSVDAGSDASADSPSDGAAGDVALDVATDADSGPGTVGIGVLGQSCPNAGDLACSGHAKKVTLLCDGSNRWANNGTCGTNQLCDSSAGVNQGTCSPVVAACAASQPGDVVCDGLDRVRCGPDLVSSAIVETCVDATRGFATCVGGICGLSCYGSSGNCDGNLSNGCETAILTSTSNCGDCGKTCSGNHVAIPTTCSSGQCDGNCSGWWGDCNRDKLTDGCETDIGTDPNNCGACRSACSANHVVNLGCNAGVCLGSCAAGWLDCDADMRSDGCETNANTLATCGVCGRVCHTASCVSGSCVGICEAGWLNCDGDLSNGCETQSGTTLNCATCGDHCGAVQACSAGVCVAAPSCRGGAAGQATCGPASNEDCCTSPLVAGGTFSRSYDGVTVGYSDARYQATVSDFRLDKYEITVGRFRKFVDAVVAGWTPAVGSGRHAHLNGGKGVADGSAPGTYESGWTSAWSTYLPTVKATWDSAAYLACDPTFQAWTTAPGANETRPVNCVNWFQADAFCIWDGGYLPSEAEWNFAAAGGPDQRTYPWGTGSPTDALAVYCGGSCASQSVGSKPAGNGKWGQADLAGNVWEWTLDWYTAPYNEQQCINCAYLAESAWRVYRGGGFASISSSLLVSYRFDGNLNVHDYSLGARCARTP